MNRLPKSIQVVILLCLGLAICPESSWAYTWRVYEDGYGLNPTIQSAIDRASSGDSVLVFPGTYYETINFSGKDIWVLSDAGPEVTVIDASQQAGNVVTFAEGETRSAALEGFTVTGGWRGILVVDAQPSILKNIIRDNGDESGAGLYCSWKTQPGPWSPLIKDNRIIHNTTQWSGGGLVIWDKMTPEIVENEIVENRAIAGDGGGILFHGWHPGSIVRGNLIAHNRAGDHGGGIIIGGHHWYDPVSVEICYNLIIGNSAEGLGHTGDSGAGICLTYSASWIHHNTLAGNTGAPYADAQGGGISIEGSGSPIIEQNIIAFAREGYGIYCFSGATAIIRNNLAWENTPAHGAGLCEDWVGFDGNTEADPQLCDPLNGIYSLAQTSPALTHPEGPLGAYPDPGCTGVPVARTTWGLLKQRYRSSRQ